ncbi:MAG: hypothetical protein ABS91_03170 [Thiobacillus sp. SCN 64-35]|nr:hypothetical protein [Thiobacillus sp.]ODU09704.1 MAG: hypothetical protein ABS91_03170 [Thiobacillus sp. SCN 64-35]ODU90237.1 MAG: hypothetical protein ABT21_06225 [Thiobacillus sp. SCN 65-179]OJW34743.1 MAG: hypothetical protein BGO61_02565 [Thiobacillus sp. 65-69]
MRKTLFLLGMLIAAGAAQADDGRYQALPLAGADGGKGGGRAFILDTRDGHVWVWTENELVVAPDGNRRYGAGFIYQGKLRPGSRPGEFIDPKQ